MFSSLTLLCNNDTCGTQDLCFPLVAKRLKSTSNKLMNLRLSAPSTHFSFAPARMLQSYGPVFRNTFIQWITWEEERTRCSNILLASFSLTLSQSVACFFVFFFFFFFATLMHNAAQLISQAWNSHTQVRPILYSYPQPFSSRFFFKNINNSIKKKKPDTNIGLCWENNNRESDHVFVFFNRATDAVSIFNEASCILTSNMV